MKDQSKNRLAPWFSLFVTLALAAATPAAATTVRMQTSLGAIYVEMYDDIAPLTVANFLAYAASGAYANSFIHRNVPGFIIQGGGFVWDAALGPVAITQRAPVVNEFKRSNLRGTIAMAKLGGDPNSATSQWFINLGNNAANLDSQNGGFTVFGQVIGDGMQVVDAIAALRTVDVSASVSALASLPLVSLPANNVIGSANLVMLSSVSAIPTTNQALAAGWNLIGNGTGTPISPSSTFGDATRVTTVWKWVAAKASWAFYAPSLSDGGASYAAGKGYEFLSSIDAGEGFWVNAKDTFTVKLPAATALNSGSFQGMAAGWNLIGVGDSPTPGQFTTAAGGNITTLWAWDASRSTWYFHAPSLAASGALSSYIAGKGYLDFTASGKTLVPGVGFWVNKP